jgi:hypothetical protein
VTDDHVTLRCEATVNGQTCAVVVEAPRAMWDGSLTNLRPDLGREQVVAVLREKLALEIAGKLDVTVTEVQPGPKPSKGQTS